MTDKIIHAKYASMDYYTFTKGLPADMLPELFISELSEINIYYWFNILYINSFHTVFPLRNWIIMS